MPRALIRHAPGCSPGGRPGHSTSRVGGTCTRSPARTDRASPEGRGDSLRGRHRWSGHAESRPGPGQPVSPISPARSDSVASAFNDDTTSRSVVATRTHGVLPPGPREPRSSPRRTAGWPVGKSIVPCRRPGRTGSSAIRGRIRGRRRLPPRRGRRIRPPSRRASRPKPPRTGRIREPTSAEGRQLLWRRGRPAWQDVGDAH